MTAYAVTSPLYPRLTLRLCAIELMSLPGVLKCSLQVVEKGRPLAEHPLAVSWWSQAELDAWITQSIADGWEITPTRHVSSMDRDRERERLRNAQRYQEARKKGVCPRCWAPLELGRSTCEPCRVKKAKATRDRKLYGKRPHIYGIGHSTTNTDAA